MMSFKKHNRKKAKKKSQQKKPNQKSQEEVQGKKGSEMERGYQVAGRQTKRARQNKE